MTDLRRNRIPAFMRERTMTAPIANVAPEMTVVRTTDGDVWLDVLTAAIPLCRSMDQAIEHADDVLKVYRSRFK